MSQSKSAYGVEEPKDSARTHRQRPDTAGDGPDPQPACRSRAVGHSIERRKWRETAYSDRLQAFFDPCSWPECFPDGPPDVSNTETVVRSSREPTVYHRPQTAECQSETESHEHGDSETDRAATVRKSISKITELRDGDGVVWDGQSEPMLVVKPTDDPGGVVQLVGSNGGEYRVEAWPECARPYYIRGYGCRNELARIVPANDQRERI